MSKKTADGTSKGGKRNTLVFILIVLAVVLVGVNRFCVLEKRRALQKRARQFLAGPMPETLKMTPALLSVPGREGEVLSVARSLISQVAENGHLDQNRSCGALAIAYAEVALCQQVVTTNNIERVYVEECKGILEAISGKH